MILELLRSLSNSVDAQIKNPIISSFVISWIMYNWLDLALLFLSDGKIEYRVNVFSESLNYYSFVVPLVMTAGYLIGIPLINLCVQKINRRVTVSRHAEAVKIDEKKEENLIKLNKMKFKANPDNGYIQKELEIESQEQFEELKRKQSKALEQEAKKETALTEQKAAKDKQVKIELERKKLEQEINRSSRLEEREKEKRIFESARHEVQMTNLRFPAAFTLIKRLSDHLRQDEVIVSLDTLCESISIILGYKNFMALLEDRKFNNDTINAMSYTLYETPIILEKFEHVLGADATDELNPETLLEAIEYCFEESSVKLIDQSNFPEFILEEVSTTEYFLEHERVTGAIAETNAFFEEEPEFEIEKAYYSKDGQSYKVHLSGVSSGDQYENKGFCGDTVSIHVELVFPVVIGKSGLAKYELEVEAAVCDPYDDEHQ